MSTTHFGIVKGFSYVQGQLALLQQRYHPGNGLPDNLFLFVHRTGTQGSTNDLGAFGKQQSQIRLGLRAALQPDHHQPPAYRKRFEVLRQILGTHDVQDQVCALALSDLLNALGKVLFAIINAFLGTQSTAILQFLRR